TILFFFTTTAPPDIYTLSLHDALPISGTADKQELPLAHSDRAVAAALWWQYRLGWARHSCSIPRIRSAQSKVAEFFGKRFQSSRSEEHTSELQSRFDLVCRLLLEKKKK